MRKQYRAEGLAESDLAATPVAQFARWFEQAATEAHLFEPNAMVVSTANAEGRPGSRTVLLKQFDDQGFVFFTNYDSRKARDLAENPYVSLLFPWHPMARQVIVTGLARRTGRDETAAYFRTRPHGSQARRLGQRPVERDRHPRRRRHLVRRTGRPLSRGRAGPGPPELGRLPGGPAGGGVLAGAREPAARPVALRGGGGRGLARGAAQSVKRVTRVTRITQVNRV